MATGCGIPQTTQLIAMAKKEIQQIGLGSAEDVVDGCVIRQRKAYPVYDDNYQAYVSYVREALEQIVPTCTWWAAMACTSTTTRTMP